MSESKNVNRREFFTTSGKISATVGAAAVVSAPAINVLGANDMVRLGIIGAGKRGYYLMDQMHRMSLQQDKPVEFIGVADIYATWRERGISRAERIAEQCTGYDHHKKLLENNDIDAVVIATPEHQHAAQLIDCLDAGKDVYCEKPMVQTIEQGKRVLQAYQGSPQVVQVGTQRRSVDLFYKAHDMVKNGDIGDVTFCEGWWNRNAADGQPGPWAYSIPEDASEDNINWDEFFYDAPKVPFDKERYFRWRSFWDYSNGIGSDLMVHQVDAICLVMGTAIPKTLVSSGGLYRWDDGRVTPDTWSCVMEFEEGFQLNYSARFSNICRRNDEQAYAERIERMEDGDAKDALEQAYNTMKLQGFFEDKVHDYGIRMAGSQGLIEIFTHHAMQVWPEPMWMWPDIDLMYQYDQFGRSVADATDLAVRMHLANFIDCVHTREQPNCTVEDGFNGAVISNMATLSYMNGAKMVWDQENMEASPA